MLNNDNNNNNNNNNSNDNDNDNNDDNDNDKIFITRLFFCKYDQKQSCDWLTSMKMFSA